MRIEEERKILVDPIIAKFLEEAKKFSKQYPEEGKALLGELMMWGAAVLGPNETLAHGIRSQIMAIVENQNSRGGNVTPEETIEGLFEPNPAGKIDAEIVMARLQLGAGIDLSSAARFGYFSKLK